MPIKFSLKIPEPWTLLCVIISLLGLVACTAMTWERLQESPYQSEVQQEIQTQQEAIASQNAAAAVPALKLNENNQQQGPAVTVPQNLGKTNPFTP